MRLYYLWRRNIQVVDIYICKDFPKGLRFDISLPVCEFKKNLKIVGCVHEIHIDILQKNCDLNEIFKSLYVYKKYCVIGSGGSNDIQHNPEISDMINLINF